MNHTTLQQNKMILLLIPKAAAISGREFDFSVIDAGSFAEVAAAEASLTE
jgi:hypothetical protein